MHIKYIYTHFFNCLLSHSYVVVTYNNTFSALCYNKSNDAHQWRIEPVAAAQNPGCIGQLSNTATSTGVSC